ncbi:hypothetical protein IAT38_001434 [Cryptococcus sp. DSM 104549]
MRPLSANFIEAARLALEWHEGGIDPVYFEIWEKLRDPGEDFLVYRLPHGLPFDTGETLPHAIAGPTPEAII